MQLKHVRYRRLNARQKENFNFQVVSGVLAFYGFVTLRLSDDWNGADFIAHHVEGEDIRVQLKSRLAFNKKYCGKDLWIAFRARDAWFLYPHDKLLKQVLAATGVRGTASWSKRGGYSFPGIPKSIRGLLEQYRITNNPGALVE